MDEHSGTGGRFEEPTKWLLVRYSLSGLKDVQPLL